MALDKLKDLHTALVDTRKGYAEAVKDAEPSTKAIFRDMLALHDRDHDEVHASLVAGGEAPDESGSFMSTVHETVIKVRSAVTGLGANSVSAFRSGEEMLLEKYDAALDEATDHPGTSAALQRQKDTLIGKIAELKALEA